VKDTRVNPSHGWGALLQSGGLRTGIDGDVLDASRDTSPAMLEDVWHDTCASSGWAIEKFPWYVSAAILPEKAKTSSISPATEF
jgi:hypothetical protein